MLETSDRELMAAVRKGDADAFAMIVDRYKDALVNYLTHLSGSRDRGEDLAQESFLRLYQSADRYREDGRLAPYLFRIGTNLVRSAQRRSARWARLLLLLPAGGNGASTPERELDNQELRAQLSAAISELPVSLRAPLLLYEMEEWSYEEIARSLRCRPGTVKSRISRARQQLRRRLAPWWNGGPH
ncbi:MAG TPA: sigma-70 family RNA polymerase sigma factor [Thermoanaerobaculia bacterium]|nr:sigma-70 family RNA polymerase sigma factor [Thermoanaerobaculia bacterium]